MKKTRKIRVRYFHGFSYDPDYIDFWSSLDEGYKKKPRKKRKKK